MPYPVIRESIIEGIEVIQETSSVKKMQSNQELVTLEDPSRAHLDIITDIAIVGSTQQLIASSSQDGVLIETVEIVFSIANNFCNNKFLLS